MHLLLPFATQFGLDAGNLDPQTLAMTHSTVRCSGSVDELSDHLQYATILKTVIETGVEAIRLDPDNCTNPSSEWVDEAAEECLEKRADGKSMNSHEIKDDCSLDDPWDPICGEDHFECSCKYSGYFAEALEINTEAIDKLLDTYKIDLKAFTGISDFTSAKLQRVSKHFKCVEMIEKVQTDGVEVLNILNNLTSVLDTDTFLPNTFTDFLEMSNNVLDPMPDLLTYIADVSDYHATYQQTIYNLLIICYQRSFKHIMYSISHELLYLLFFI